MNTDVPDQPACQVCARIGGFRRAPAPLRQQNISTVHINWAKAKRQRDVPGEVLVEIHPQIATLNKLGWKNDHNEQTWFESKNKKGEIKAQEEAAQQSLYLRGGRFRIMWHRRGERYSSGSH
jgi:hypothetical protein